jgi:phage tail tape-measure protein
VAVGAPDGSLVGAVVGTEVGAAEGTAVGSVVGGVVGCPVGSPLGVAVGAPEGSLVGAVVGADVGAAVGTAVGSAVGAPEGSPVGAAVGMEVGTAVGSVVGTEVGGGVGCPVGSPLGAPVAWSFRPRSADPSSVTSTAVWAQLRTTAANNITTRRPLHPPMVMCPHPYPPHAPEAQLAGRCAGFRRTAAHQIRARAGDGPCLVVVGDQMDIELCCIPRYWYRTVGTTRIHWADSIRVFN